MSGEDPGPGLLAAVMKAFPLAAARSSAAVVRAFPAGQGTGRPAMFVLADAGGARVSVRVEVSLLPEGTLARLHPNTHSGNHVIQVSSRAAPQDAEAILARQLEELHAVLAAAARAAEARPRDLLVPGPLLPLAPHLTPADTSRLADLDEAARAMGAARAGTQAHADARARFSAFLDGLGLREAGPGAGDAPAVRARQAIAATQLTAPAAAALRDLGRPAGQLDAADARVLARIRASAGPGGSAQGKGRGRAATAAGSRWSDLPGLALEAARTRAAASAATLAWLRGEQSRLRAGQHPRLPVMIGAGAAVIARDSRMLVIDSREGWHTAAFWSLGQAADQLRGVSGTGLGDPCDFAPGPERVPLDALRYWQDKAAARGPAVDGRAVLRAGADGRLLVDIAPGDGSPSLTVEAEGAPVIATGFPPERVPGYALEVQTLPAAARVLARHCPEAWPDIAAALGERDPGRALAAWLRQAGTRLPAGREGTLLNPAIRTVGATAAWETLRRRAPGLAVTGDELTYGQASPSAARRWLIAGTGGSGYTSAEFILHANPDAEVTMVGIGARETLRNMPVYASVTQAHVAAAGGDGRLTVIDGQPLVGQVETSWQAGQAVFRTCGHQGSAYAACLGRSGNLPAPADPLAMWAYSCSGGRADGRLLYDSHRQYLGYQVTFSVPGQQHQIEVTGAASRGLPTEIFGPDTVHNAVTLWAQELPPESGNPPGSYLSTALQAHLYAAYRAGGARGQQTEP